MRPGPFLDSMSLVAVSQLGRDLLVSFLTI
jgi:hypothetical protein